MNKRSVNLDIIRITAFFLVICVHSLLYSNFYNTVNSSFIMALTQILRVFFMTCVPLFIILSGYLMKDKTVNKKYYVKLSRVIITYIICSIICFLYTNLFYEKLPFYLLIKTTVLKILWFEAAPYSWYINMYIGLYLLIPFLNILWKSLKSEHEQRNLLFTLFIMTIIPTIINIKFMIVPNYWVGHLYIILYYYVGSYICCNDIDFTLLKKTVMFIICILWGLLNYYLCRGQLFIESSYNDFCSLGTFVASILIFVSILNINYSWKNQLLVKIIKKISYLTLAAYLLSYVFDSIIYSHILNGASFLQNIKLIIICIFLVFVFSLLLAWFEYIIEQLLKNIWNFLKKLFHLNN